MADRKEEMRAKVLRTIDLLEENGPAFRLPYSGPLGDEIFKLRTKQGSDITRVLYFFFIGKRAVLTNGFVKKTQKTPPSVIEIARK
ncbi:MAG: type II toxin-antitoxin system RelE/ParE family toxin [Bilifractor sp.]